MNAPQPPKGAWTIVLLLFLFMVINFADKAVIGLAAVPIMQELRLTPKQFGLIVFPAPHIAEPPVPAHAERAERILGKSRSLHPGIERCQSGPRVGSTTVTLLRGDRWFESGFLHRRVRKLSVPLGDDALVYQDPASCRGAAHAVLAALLDMSPGPAS